MPWWKTKHHSPIRQWHLNSFANDYWENGLDIDDEGDFEIDDNGEEDADVNKYGAKEVGGDDRKKIFFQVNRADDVVCNGVIDSIVGVSSRIGSNCRASVIVGLVTEIPAIRHRK